MSKKGWLAIAFGGWIIIGLVGLVVSIGKESLLKHYDEDAARIERENIQRQKREAAEAARRQHEVELANCRQRLISIAESETNARRTANLARDSIYYRTLLCDRGGPGLGRLHSEWHRLRQFCAGATDDRALLNGFGLAQAIRYDQEFCAIRRR